MPEKKWTKTDQARAEEQERGVVKYETQCIRFFTEARTAFAFLNKQYGYGLGSETIWEPWSPVDVTAQLAHISYRMHVRISCLITSGNISIQFATRPKYELPPEQAARLQKYMDLYGLARYLGMDDDPDFLLGDMWNHYASKAERRMALIESNLHGVLEGLARATERYASHVLMGDSSQFDDVRAYYEAHKDDYIRGKKVRRQVIQ
jgi:hypothetical protein